MGRPTSEAKVALGKLSPANPIFMYPVPGSQIMAGFCIWLIILLRLLYKIYVFINFDDFTT